MFKKKRKLLTNRQIAPQKTWLSSRFGELHLLCGSGGPPARLHAAARVNPQEECQENDSDPKAPHYSDGVTVQEAGQQDGEGLPQRHDDGEDGCAELVDGVEDEELAARRADGQQHRMKGKLRVTHHEGQRVKEGTLLEQRAHGEEAGEHVHPEHHLHRRHLVLEQVVLPVRGEAVEHDVAHEDDDAAEGGDGGRMLVLRAGEEEHADSNGDQQSSEVLPVLVILLRNDLPHKHDGDDFGGFGQHLRGEADELEGLVLTPAAHDVGERSEGILVHGSTVARLLEQQAPQARHSQSKDAVHEHQELGVCKSLFPFLRSRGSVRTSHHPLLEDSPCQV